jgi:4-coumarate--CoA ligase (photoactive yellow protein activation family)
MSVGGHPSRADGAVLAPAPRPSDAPFAVGEAPRTWGELLADAAALAEALGSASDEIVVACGDRYFGAVALVATWRAGRVAALPPNGRPESIDALADARGISVILHDGGGAGPRALDVRGRVGARAAAALDVPKFAAQRTLACVYTSGSTGAPLPCRKTAGQLLGEAAMLARTFDVGPGARVLATVPAHHIYGLLFGTLVPFMGGGALVRATPLHAETIAAAVRAHGADVLCSVPAHLRGLGELAVGALPGLRRVFSSAAPLPPETATRVAAIVGRNVTEILGSSETGGVAWRDGTEGPGWRPLPGVEVAADVDGAMLVRSPFVEGQGDANAPAHRGADRIRALLDGRFELVGRADGILKIGGARVSVAEIERRLRELPGVADAAVLPVDVGGARGHELWAAVAPATVDVTALRAALLLEVDAVAVPRRFRAVATLPREENGKLTRERLAGLFPLRARAAAPDDGHADVLVVPRDWSFFEGHFEGFPILAGVVQMTEVVLPRIAARWPELRRPRRLTGLKFRSPIKPGDTIDVELARAAPLKVSFALRRDTLVVSSGALEFAEEPA